MKASPAGKKGSTKASAARRRHARQYYWDDIWGEVDQAWTTQAVEEETRKDQKRNKRQAKKSAKELANGASTASAPKDAAPCSKSKSGRATDKEDAEATHSTPGHCAPKQVEKDGAGSIQVPRLLDRADPHFRDALGACAARQDKMHAAISAGDAARLVEFASNTVPPPKWEAPRVTAGDVERKQRESQGLRKRRQEMCEKWKRTLEGKRDRIESLDLGKRAGTSADILQKTNAAVSAASQELQDLYAELNMHGRKAVLVQRNCVSDEEHDEGKLNRALTDLKHGANAVRHKATDAAAKQLLPDESLYEHLEVVNLVDEEAQHLLEEAKDWCTENTNHDTEVNDQITTTPGTLREKREELQSQIERESQDHEALLSEIEDTREEIVRTRKAFLAAIEAHEERKAAAEMLRMEKMSDEARLRKLDEEIKEVDKLVLNTPSSNGGRMEDCVPDVLRGIVSTAVGKFKPDAQKLAQAAMDNCACATAYMDKLIGEKQTELKYHRENRRDMEQQFEGMHYMSNDRFRLVERRNELSELITACEAELGGHEQLKAQAKEHMERLSGFQLDVSSDKARKTAEATVRASYRGESVFLAERTSELQPQALVVASQDILQQLRQIPEIAGIIEKMQAEKRTEPQRQQRKALRRARALARRTQESELSEDSTTSLSEDSTTSDGESAP